jgi:four helix bundle protein
MKELRDFGFRDQITRSALSIPSNIAEGEERASNKEKVRFLYYSKGSTAELITQIYIGIDIGYIEKQTGLEMVKEAKEIAAIISKLIKNKQKLYK